MRLIPRHKASRITFCLVLAERWAQHAAELGLDPIMVAQLQDRVEATRLAFNAKLRARDAARSATGNFNIALKQMTTLTANLISQVRATAAHEGDRIYPLAALPIPAKPSRLASPGTPTNFTTELQQVGWLTLRWDCRNPRGAVGTMYHVHRQVRAADGTMGPREFLGIAGKKEFTDSTLPPGSAAVEYHVRAIRSTAYGEEANHLVNFGASFAVGAPGQMQLAA